MGQAISSIAEDHGCRITHPVDLGDDPAEFISDSDLVIDFPSAMQPVLLPNWLLKTTNPLLLGPRDTTRMTAKQSKK